MKKIRGCTIIDDPPFFESSGREESVDPTSRDMGCEGPSSTQGEGNSSFLKGDNQGLVTMIWDGMLPGEQESAKKITDEDDWIIWGVKPPRGDSEGQEEMDRWWSLGTTDFLERHGTRLEGIKPKGKKTRRTSENVSRGGFTRRKGWYRTNDIRTITCSRDMAIWVPKSGKGFSPESIETIWETW